MFMNRRTFVFCASAAASLSLAAGSLYFNNMWHRNAFVPSKEVPTSEAPNERVIQISGMINDACANEVIAKLLFHQMKSRTEPVVLEIDSPGGSFTATIAILETLQSVHCPVRTECPGQADGYAVLLLAAGAPGHRRAVPEAKFHFCQSVVVENSGPQARFYLEKIHTRLVQELSSVCNQLKQRIEDDIAAERSFTFEEAVRYGLVDGALVTR